MDRGFVKGEDTYVLSMLSVWWASSLTPSRTGYSVNSGVNYVWHGKEEAAGGEDRTG